MSRATLILANPSVRSRAHAWIDQAPDDTRVEFKGPKRSLEQNARMWALLTDVATQLPWHGQKLKPDDWKLIFMDALRRELNEPVCIVPNTDGTGFVNIGTSSSQLSVGEMGGLMTLIEKFGAEHGVVFHDSERSAA